MRIAPSPSLRAPFTHVERHTRHGPPQLPSKVGIVPPNRSCNRRHVSNQLQNGFVNPQHRSLLPSPPKRGRPPRRVARRRCQGRRAQRAAAQRRAASLTPPSTTRR
ncbi:hypothetical protein AKJ09_00289 [Labilithrix luteola]|uniref:Uncharacterized protein n=1 Tax=Labilithrix luteola TaxID=1391654 RepID=A0A0K1PJC6_9BACT|nr:hypothetical protein AKJ09_00289 [Labilithrix luteola]